MKAKTKTRTKPALTDSAKSGLRPPIEGSMTMAGENQKCLRKSTKRQRAMAAVGVVDRGSRRREQVWGSAHFKGPVSRQPSQAGRK